MNIQPPIPVWLAWGENVSEGGPLLAGNVVAGEIVAINEPQEGPDMPDEILTNEEIAGIRARHYPDPVYGRCMTCNGTRWPCDVWMLAESHAALQARLPLLEAALAVLRAGRRFGRAITADAPDEDEIAAALNERDDAYERYQAAEARGAA